MGCRAGITTRPDERKTEWQRKYPNMHNWKVSEFPTRRDAQLWEDSQPYDVTITPIKIYSGCSPLNSGMKATLCTITSYDN